MSHSHNLNAMVRRKRIHTTVWMVHWHRKASLALSACCHVHTQCKSIQGVFQTQNPAAKLFYLQL